MTDASQVLAALDTVRDPELDEPVTSLGFVASCTVSPDGVASVRLRLPTYFCAPNFAYLMVADAYDAVSAVEGVQRADVVLEDHFASDTINAGVAGRSGFVQSFDGEAVDELDSLRADFLRKAVLAGTDRVCRPMLASGVTTDELAGLTLGEAPATPDRERLRSRRAAAGPARRGRRAAAGRRRHRCGRRCRGAAAAPGTDAPDPGQRRGQQRGVPRPAARPVSLDGRSGPDP